MRQWLSVALVVASVGGGIWACTGDTGPAGPAGAPGTATQSAAGPAGANGTNGTNGTNGDAGADGLVISNGAQHGLSISPVALNLAGKTADELEMIGNGSYIVNAVVGCGDCHNTPGATLKFLAGGSAFGPVHARNLTPDPTTGLKLSEADFITLMRTGKDFTQKDDAGGDEALIVMPWTVFRWMSTYDLRSIYAYLKVIPAVTNAIPADTKPAIPPTPFPTSYNDSATTSPVPLPPETAPDPDNVLRGLAINPLAVGAPSEAQAAALFGRGSYLVNSQAACNDCHTNPDRASGKINTAQFLTGGRVFAVPAALQPTTKYVRSMSANLIGKTKGYFGPTANPTMSFPEWMTEITQGVHADMGPPSPPLAFPMPAAHYKDMTIGDLEAIYTYVRMLAVNANIVGANDKATQDPARYCTAATQAADCTNAGETCNAATNECVGKSCNQDSDCDACQTCTANQCAAPASNAACLTSGL